MRHELAVFVSVAQSLFANRLLQEVPNKVPGANPQLVLAAGATEVRKVFPASQLPGIIASYMDGLKDAYILSIALMGVATIVTLVTMILDRRRLPVGKGAPVGAA